MNRVWTRILNPNSNLDTEFDILLNLIEDDNKKVEIRPFPSIFDQIRHFGLNYRNFYTIIFDLLIKKDWKWINLIEIISKIAGKNWKLIENYRISNLSFNRNSILKPDFESSSICNSNSDLESESSSTIRCRTSIHINLALCG